MNWVHAAAAVPVAVLVMTAWDAVAGWARRRRAAREANELEGCLFCCKPARFRENTTSC